MPINQIYDGSDAVAVTQFKSQYALKFAASYKELRQRLDSESQLLGPQYEVLAIYDRINFVKCEQRLDDAIKALESGEKPNLEIVLA